FSQSYFHHTSYKCRYVVLSQIMNPVAQSPREPGKAGSLTLFSIYPVLGTSCLANGLCHSCQMSFRSVCSRANFRIMSAISSIEKGLPKIIHILCKRDYLTPFLFAH